MTSNMRSTSTYLHLLEEIWLHLRSKKQKVVSQSSAEAEYKGMVQDVCEFLWLHKLLGCLGCLGFKPKDAMQFYCDNKFARDIVDNSIQHD